MQQDKTQRLKTNGFLKIVPSLRGPLRTTQFEFFLNGDYSALRQTVRLPNTALFCGL